MYKKIMLFLFLFLFVPNSVFAITKGTKVDTVTITSDKCVDGNNARFMLGSNEIKIRFLGTTVPEPVHPTEDALYLHEEASNYVCKTLLNAKKIQLEYDPNSKETDSLGRTLAWVYVDGKLLQNLLVEKGYVDLDLNMEDYLYSDMLNDSLVKAKEEKNGFWGIDREEKNIESIPKEQKEEVIEETNIFRLILGKVLDFINEIFEKFLKSIDNLIENML